MSGYLDRDEHSLLSASAAPRWANCTGALFGSIGYESESSEYAKEGSAMHRLAATCLTYGKPAAAYVGRVFTEEGVDFEVTDARAAFVQMYLDKLAEYRERPGREPLEWHIEAQVNYSAFLGVPSDKAWGTSDCYMLDYEEHEIQVHDLKFGVGERIYAKDNEQLTLYAGGVLERVDLLGTWKTVRIVVHQPRLHHLDEWVISVHDLRNALVRLSVQAKRALRQYEGLEPPEYTAGEKQCRWCPFAADCPEARNRVLNAALEGFSEVDTDPSNVKVRAVPDDINALSRAGLLLPFVQDWCNNVAARLDVLMLHRGEKVPFFKVVRGRSPGRKWDNPSAVGELLRPLIGDLAYKPRELQSPAEMEKIPLLREKQGRKLVPVAALQQAMNEYMRTPPGKLQVVPVSDPRPEEAVDPTAGFDEVDSSSISQE